MRWPRWPRSTKAPRFPCRRTGAAIGCVRRRSSSGYIATTASTTGSATRGTQNAAGASSAWLRKEEAPVVAPELFRSSLPRSRGRLGWGRLLAAIGDQRGVEVVARVVAAGGDQPHAGLDVGERTGLPLVLAGDLEILGAAVDGELDILAVAGANRDHVAVDALDLSGDVRAADVNTLRVEFAVALLEANPDVAVDFDLRPGRLIIATLDHDGGIGPQERLAARLRVFDGQLGGADRRDRA